MPLSILTRTALPSAFDRGKHIQPLCFLQNYEPRLDGKVKVRLTLGGLLVSLTSKYFSARITSKVSSGTPPRSDVNVGSNSQDEGSRLSGIKSDLDNPVGDRVNDTFRSQWEV